MGKMYTIEESKEIIEKLGNVKKRILRTVSEAENILASMKRDNIPDKSIEIDGITKTISEHLQGMIDASNENLAVLDNAVNEEKLSIALLNSDTDNVFKNPVFEKMFLLPR